MAWGGGGVIGLRQSLLSYSVFTYFLSLTFPPFPPIPLLFHAAPLLLSQPHCSLTLALSLHHSNTYYKPRISERSFSKILRNFNASLGAQRETKRGLRYLSFPNTYSKIIFCNPESRIHSSFGFSAFGQLNS